MSFKRIARRPQQECFRIKDPLTSSATIITRDEVISKISSILVAWSLQMKLITRDEMLKLRSDKLGTEMRI